VLFVLHNNAFLDIRHFLMRCPSFNYSFDRHCVWAKVFSP